MIISRWWHVGHPCVVLTDEAIPLAPADAGAGRGLRAGPVGAEINLVHAVAAAARAAAPVRIRRPIALVVDVPPRVGDILVLETGRAGIDPDAAGLAGAVVPLAARNWPVVQEALLQLPVATAPGRVGQGESGGAQRE